MKWIITAFGLIGSLLIYYYTSSEKVPQAVDSGPNSKKLRIPLKDQKYSKSSNNIESNTKKNSLLPEKCQSFLDQITELTKEELIDEISKKNIRITSTCFKNAAENPIFSGIKECEFKADTLQNNSETCVGALILLKVLNVASNIQEEDYGKVLDSELAALAMQAFFRLSDKLTKEEFEKNGQVFREFMSRFPDDLRVIEAMAGYLMIGGQITGFKDKLAEVDTLLEDFSGKDFKLDRLQIIRHAINNDFESAKKILIELEKIYPGEAELAYFKAAYYWKMKDRNNALLHLNKALSSVAKCSYCSPDAYKVTLESVKKARLGQENLFILGIGLNFDDL